MPIVTGHYTLDRSKLPTKADELRVRFVPQLVNDKNTLLVLYPNSEPGFEPLYVRYVAEMKLRLGARSNCGHGSAAHRHDHRWLRGQGRLERICWPRVRVRARPGRFWSSRDQEELARQAGRGTHPVEGGSESC